MCLCARVNATSLNVCRVIWRSWRVCQWPPLWTETRSPSHPHKSASSSLSSSLSLSLSVSSSQRLRLDPYTDKGWLAWPMPLFFVGGGGEWGNEREVAGWWERATYDIWFSYAAHLQANPCIALCSNVKSLCSLTHCGRYIHWLGKKHKCPLFLHRVVAEPFFYKAVSSCIW